MRGDKMKTFERDYTDKFPKLYTIQLNGYIITTTDKNKFYKLVEYFKTLPDEIYAHIPTHKRIEIECVFTVRRFEARI